MGFKLENDDGPSLASGTVSSASQNNYNNTTPNKPSESKGTFVDDTFDPATEDSVFIMDKYNTTIPTDGTVSGVHYLTESKKFPPILMLIGVAFQLLAIFSVVRVFQNGNFTSANLDSINNSIISISVMSFIGYAFMIIDAFAMYKQKIASGSLIAWAVFFPIVYFFKRCKANGNTSLIALLIVLVQIGAGIYGMNVGINATFESMGIVINDTGLKGAVMAAEQMDVLSTYYITADYGSFYYDQLIAGNVKDPTYQYIDNISTLPDFFTVKGTTTVRGAEENITINFNYSTMYIYSIVIGDKTYSSNLDLYEILYYMSRNLSTPALR